MQLQDDSYYIGLVLRGDQRAFTVLVDRHKQLIYSFALRMLRVPEDAEEVAHDAFVKAYQSLSSFRSESRFSTWLCRIVYNESVSRLRKKKLKMHSFEEPGFAKFDLAAADQSLAEMTEQELQVMIDLALGALPDDERSIISLFYLHEQPVKEIAGITGLSESNVKIKLFRARKRMWEYLSTHNISSTLQEGRMYG
ncbi:MAG: RNA polymerase sigma factor [Bacteroidales bacterium]